MNDLLIYLLKSAALLTVFLAFYWLLLKKDTSFGTNRKFLLGGLLTSAGLPAILFTRTIIVEAPRQQFFPAPENFPVNEVVAQEPLLSVWEIFASIYFLGVAVMLLRLVFQVFSLLMVLYSGKNNHRNGFNFIETNRNIAPFSFLNYIVYNPALHLEKDLDHILKHEKVHVSQWHTLDVLLANLNLIYQWFNPFAWSYNKNLQQNLEFIADKEAVKEASCIKEYQKTLVKLSVENFHLALTNNFFQSLIKTRIMMLNKQTSGKNNTWKAILIIPALVVFLLIFNTKTVAQVKETQEISPASTMEVTISISKNTTNQELETFKKVMAKQNLILDFENIKRSNDGLLTAITIDFLNRVNNNSGTFTKNDPEGIETFSIKMTGDGKAAFADSNNFVGDSTNQQDKMLRKMGIDPLYIIDDKKYSTTDLDGKTIKYKTGYMFLDPENAEKSYGNKAKNGAFIFSEGNIINDFDAELKAIDEQNEAVTHKYVQIVKGKKPSFIELQNNPGNAPITATSETSRVKKEINGDPIYIVNGRIVKNADSIKEIDPKNITGINVLKGAAATSFYGKKAKDGAIIITTKPVDTLKTGSFNFGTGNLNLLDTVSGKTRTYYASHLNLNKDSIQGRAIQINYNGDRPYTISIQGDKVNASQNVSGTDTKVFLFSMENDQNRPLYIIDGKETNKESMDEVAPQNIKAINVLKGESAIEKYGKKGENGVIEVTLKKTKEKD